VPEQKISVKNTLIAYIQGGAFSSKEENIKGRIMAGFFADITVFSQNLFDIPTNEIYKTKVLLTILIARLFIRIRLVCSSASSLNVKTFSFSTGL